MINGYPEGTGPCVKQEVTATLITTDGEKFIGKNYCNKPQIECPREKLGMQTGEGYHLCKDACDQSAHAEVNAINSAGDKAIGSVIYLSGHTYACDSCKNSAKSAGVVDIVVVLDDEEKTL